MFESSTEEQVCSAEDLVPLGISLYPEGDASGLHMLNDPMDPFQRDTIIERNRRVDVRCEHKDIVHGNWSAEGDELCTLIVLEFQFAPGGTARRIKEAHVEMEFAPLNASPRSLEVQDMYPKGVFHVEPTTQEETLIHSGSANVGGGALGLQIGAELKAEHTVRRESSDTTLVKGSINHKGRHWGPKNSVSWTLLENSTAKTGVVSHIQAAVRLRRQHMEHFKAIVTIRIKADVMTNIGSYFRTDKDDEVFYNPERQPPSTDRLEKYDVNNLGAFDLKSASGVTFKTALRGTTKEE